MQSDEPAVVANVDQVSWYKRHWVKWVAISVIVLAVVIAAGTTLLLLKWNASLEKALLEAVDYASKNPGTYHIRLSSNDNIVARVDGNTSAFEGSFKNAPIALIVSGTMLYVKSSEPKHLYDAFLGAPTGASKKLLSGLLSDLKNQWIVFDLETTAKTSSLFEDIRCFVDAKNTLATDSSGARRNIGGAYFAHPFIAATDNNDSHRRLTIDEGILMAFLSETSRAKTTENHSTCLQTIDAHRNIHGRSVVTVALSKSTNKLESVTYQRGESEVFSVKADYDKMERIFIPANAIDVSQLIGGLFESLLGADRKR